MHAYVYTQGQSSREANWKYGLATFTVNETSFMSSSHSPVLTEKIHREIQEYSAWVLYRRRESDLVLSNKPYIVLHMDDTSLSDKTVSK